MSVQTALRAIASSIAANEAGVVADDKVAEQARRNRRLMAAKFHQLAETPQPHFDEFESIVAGCKLNTVAVDPALHAAAVKAFGF